MKEIVLRPYQQSGVNGVRDVYRSGKKSALFCSPTGSGKTITAAYILMGATNKGNLSYFCVNRIELVDQTAETLDRFGIDYGYICAGRHYFPGKSVYICMVQTLARRVSKVPTPNFVVWDECRGIAAKSVDEIYRQYPDAYHLGLDATPERPDGKGLGRWFGDLVMGPSYKELQSIGSLVPFRVLAVSKVDTQGLHMRAGEFVAEEVDERMNRKEITGDAVQTFKDLGPGHKCLTFAASVKHSQGISEVYREAGIPWAHVDGETPDADRRHALRSIRNGEIQGISNVDLFVAGLDVTEIDTIQWLRMTKSLPRFLQGCGRGSRPHEGKTHCTLLDHAANVGELRLGVFYPNHGLPDQDREWSLDGRVKRKVASLKKCPQCGGMVSSLSRICGSPLPGGETCEFSWCEDDASRGRVVPEVVDGNMEWLTPEQAAQSEAIAKRKKGQQYWSCKTEDDFFKFAIQHNYKKPRWWASQAFVRRQEKINA